MLHLILKIRAQSDLVSFDQQFFPFYWYFFIDFKWYCILKKKKKKKKSYPSILYVHLCTWNKINFFGIRKKNSFLCSVRTLMRIRQSFKLFYLNKNIWHNWILCNWKTERLFYNLVNLFWTKTMNETIEKVDPV